jgi:hypothetical protein
MGMLVEVCGPRAHDDQIRSVRPEWTRVSHRKPPPCLRSLCSQPQMDCGLHICLDGRRLAVLAAVIDLFSRRVVGWSMSAAMTAQLVTNALVMAIWRRGKPDALVHHSDRGSQYTSEQFQSLMADHGVVCSMSRSGNVWDNAAPPASTVMTSRRFIFALIRSPRHQAHRARRIFAGRVGSFSSLPWAAAITPSATFFQL